MDGEDRMKIIIKNDSALLINPLSSPAVRIIMLSL